METGPLPRLYTLVGWGGGGGEAICRQWYCLTLRQCMYFLSVQYANRKGRIYYVGFLFFVFVGESRERWKRQETINRKYHLIKTLKCGTGNSDIKIKSGNVCSTKFNNNLPFTFFAPPTNFPVDISPVIENYVNTNRLSHCLLVNFIFIEPLLKLHFV